MTDRYDELRAAAEKASNGNLDTAERVTVGEIECPLCGDGTIDHKTWTNIDDKPIGIEVFGLGEALTNYETFVRLANPETVLALLHALAEANERASLLQTELDAARSEGPTNTAGETRDGWVLVPREPTMRMLHHGDKAQYGASAEWLGRDIYRAMIAAAPSQEAVVSEGMVEAFKRFYRERGVYLNHGLDNHLHDAISAALKAQGASEGVGLIAKRLDEWCDGDGNVLWWDFPICEPPYAGTPNDDEFPDYKTHWTPIGPMPAPPASSAGEA